MQESEVSIQVLTKLDLEIKKQFEFEIQTKLTWISFVPCNSEKMLKHCSYYSDTRGVTALHPNRNLDPRFGRRNNSNRDREQSHIRSLW
jgi:hypothetical protein